MPEWIVTTGNFAAAYAAKAAEVDVVAAYPITPQTRIVEKIAEFVEKGEMKAKFIRVESEHSAMAVCIGAAAAGARAFTATSSHGLALMHEMVVWAALGRLPIVMAVVNRAMAPGWNIWADHNDTIAQRDTGWIQFYARSNQEVHDTILQAYKICESEDVLLPAMVCLDGFILSHTSQPVEVLSEDDVRDYLGRYEPKHCLLDPENPKTYGNIVFPEDYIKFRHQMQQAMQRAKEIIEKVDEEFGKKFGEIHSHGGLLDPYRCEDAEIIATAMGTMASELEEAVDHLRKDGIKAGSISIRTFRPFPEEELRSLCENAKAVVVFDRNISCGLSGASYSEIRSALYDMPNRPAVVGFLAGIGGCDVTWRHLYEAIKKVALAERPPSGKVFWVGV